MNINKKLTLFKHLTLQNIRRTYSVFFFLLFLFFLIITDYRNLKGYEVTLFLELNPLTALSTFFTSGTVYRGLALSLCVIIPSLFFGRFFCSWICPMGILNQWISYIFIRRKKSDTIHINSYQKNYRLKYYFLVFLLILSLFGSLQIGLLDPISFISRSFIISVLPALYLGGLPLYFKSALFSGGILIGALFVLVLFLNRFITRFWCRYICPLGALLGILSLGSLLRIRRDVEKCTDCNECLKHCQGGCDPHSLLRVSECHVCMNCIEECPEGALHYGLPLAESSVHMPFDINRRRLLETGVASLIFLPMMKISLSGENKAHAEVIRPPGSLEERDFQKRCIKCSECMRVCPTNVIQPALLEGGFTGLWSPILINRIGYCEYNCVLCGQVCPTGAIREITVREKTGKGDYKKPVKIGTAFFDRGLCLPWAMNRECIVCEEVCPTSPKAIWFKTEEITTRDGIKKRLKRPFLDPELCTGCGACEHKCPVKGRAAIRVTSVGEDRSRENQMILRKL